MTASPHHAWRVAAGTRIAERIEALARISESPDALTRIYLSPEQRRAAELIMTWMTEAGMTARLDAIGNVVGRLEGASPGLPCLMLGSHYDTVRDAGKWDGALGVIAAIECAAEIARCGRSLPFALEVVAFADEEGVRFSSTLLGSRAMAGTLDPQVLETRGADGLTMAEAMAAFGLPPDRIREARRQRGDILGYCELHIEQGPVLEAESVPVGVVTAISGASRFAVDIAGEAGHAGTVPMALRRDALAAAAESVLAVERLCRAEAGLVGTVGYLAAEPGATNVIPGRARFTIDVRAAVDSMRRRAAAAMIREIEAIAAARGVTGQVTQTHDNGTAPCAAWLRGQLAEAVAAEGYRVIELPSGAGHDGMAMVDVTDIAMLFVRCREGISHNPLESVTSEDAAAGAGVLLRFVEGFRPRGAEGERAGSATQS